MKNPTGSTLKNWLARRGMKQNFMAAKLGITESMMSRWLSGESVPDKKQKQAISRFTGGAVPVRAWK